MLLLHQEENLDLCLYKKHDEEYNLPSSNSLKVTFIDSSTRYVTAIWIEKNEILSGICGKRELLLKPDNETYCFHFFQKEGLIVRGQRFFVSLRIKINQNGIDFYKDVASFIIFEEDFANNND
eukprot:TRINITY_DN2132_c0_g1_i1.p1 TRINITY_DN2132_c0_g1~~TRINITY_DN2132_c0_g1_i1.p1  ORF type:complete len:123 (+),score=36.39 TRINITY_DN2132_c0_g1_i1:403-771(+)